MDPLHVDDLVGDLATPTSRRNALKVLAALAGASGLSALPIPGIDRGALAALSKEAHGERASAGARLTGRLVYPSSPDYDTARLGWARQFNRFPLVIVFCQSAQDVVNALSWCRENNVAFRARSGRHSLEGWSALDGGVVIDVSAMNQIHLDTSARLATVQTGATQGAVVTALGKLGYAIPSGGEAPPGIAGVVLGGGLGLLVRTMGMACDHLVGLDMVIPSGTQGAQVIRVDAQNNSDLLWASRGGGGGNFGIATSFTFAIQPISTVTLFDVTWDAADWHHFSEILGAWQDLVPSADDRLNSILSAFPPTHGKGSIEVQGWFIGSEEALLRRLLQPVLGIGTPNVTIQTMRYLDAWLRFALPPALPHIDKFSSVFAYSSLPPQGVETVRSYMAAAPNPDSNLYCLAWGGAVGRIPTGAAAFFHRGPRFYMEWDATWRNDREEKLAVAWIEQFRGALAPYVTGSYINVPDRSINDLRTYYGDNLARLKEVKRTYDPENVFHFEQSIPPG